jgi:pimeloyl-ACP methyl ester carboxylesterase
MRRKRTEPFRDANGDVIPRSIAEVGYPKLGGQPQYVMIRGADICNPPLVVLHGGPGFSDTTFFRRFNAQLEKAFTVVYWDQRGTGKSYHRRIPKDSMTVERFLADLDELIEIVRARTGNERVVLFGHSWGSALGVIYAARFPHKVSAYVGSGQYGDAVAGESASYEYAVSEAERAGDRKVTLKLRAIGPPPYGPEGLWTERFALNRLEGMFRPKTLLGLARTFLGAPEFSMFDVPRLIRGFKFSIDAMWEESSRIDLTTLVPALEVPVFFFLGRNDHWVPPVASVAYFERLIAPSKRLVFFEASGHEPFVDEAAKFNALMEELVRPAAMASPVSERTRRPA